MQWTPWVEQGRPGPLVSPTGCCRPLPSQGLLGSLTPDRASAPSPLTWMEGLSGGWGGRQAGRRARIWSPEGTPGGGWQAWW